MIGCRGNQFDGCTSLVLNKDIRTTAYIANNCNTIEPDDFGAQRNRREGFSIIDAALAEPLRGNRFAFIKPSSVTVEYSRDAGATWTNYGASEDDITNIFTLPRHSTQLTVGKSDGSTYTADENAQLRITIDQATSNVYSKLSKFILNISINGSTNCMVTVEGLMKNNNTYTELGKTSLGGWPDYNVLNIPAFTFGSGSSHYTKLRFTFTCGAMNGSYTGLAVLNIFAYGGVLWSSSNIYARTGNPYTLSTDKTATFFGKVASAEAPTEDNDLVNKKYVDNITSSFVSGKVTTITVPTTGWTTSTDTNGTTYYSINITDSILTSTGYPITDVVLPSDIVAARLQSEAYQNVNKITVNDGSVTLYCFDSLPTVSFQIRIQLLYI